MRLTPEQREEAIVFIVVAVLIALFAVFFGDATAAEPPREARAYQRDLTRNARHVWGLDAPVATFAAQIHQESGWRPDAVSRVGAKGMAQFMPSTAAWWCDLNNMDAGSCQPTHPIWAIRALVGYDRWLWERIQERPCARMQLALRAYNGGLGYVQREQRTGRPCEAFRAAWACRENLAYPARIVGRLQPLYLAWGRGVCA